jgi:hypothetical protein
MEVDDLNQSVDAVDAHATEDDLLFAEDGVDAAEYTTGEVDQLLGEDEDTEKYYAEEVADVEGIDAEGAHEEEGGEGEEHEEEGEEEEGGEEGESSYGYRGRGMRRPFFRGMRGGRFMMRGMMMMGPPRFFPPMHPGMRPPFPPFMGPGRPPFAMRGMRPMRLPMPIPPHFMRMPGVYHRYGGPTATRGRGGSNESRPAVTAESGDTPPTTTKSDGPLPLMSIPTPEFKSIGVIMPALAQRGRGIIGMGMGPRYHGMQSRGGATTATPSYRGSTSSSASHSRMPLKRPATSNGVQPMHVDHSEPQPKMSKPRNTLTYTHARWLFAHSVVGVFSLQYTDSNALHFGNFSLHPCGHPLHHPDALCSTCCPLPSAVQQRLSTSASLHTGCCCTYAIRCLSQASAKSNTDSSYTLGLVAWSCS